MPKEMMPLRHVELIARVTKPETGRTHIVRLNLTLDINNPDEDGRRQDIAEWCNQWSLALVTEPDQTR